MSTLSRRVGVFVWSVVAGGLNIVAALWQTEDHSCVPPWLNLSIACACLITGFIYFAFSE